MKLIKKTANILEYRINYWFAKIFSSAIFSYFTGAIIYFSNNSQLKCQAAIVGVNCQISRVNIIPNSQPTIDELNNIIKVEVIERTSNNASQVLLSNGVNSLSFEANSDNDAIEIGDRLTNYLQQPTNEPLVIERDFNLYWFVILLFFGAVYGFVMPTASTVKLYFHSQQLVTTNYFAIARPKVEKYPFQAIVDVRVDKKSDPEGRTNYIPTVYLKNGRKTEKITLFTAGFDLKKQQAETLVSDIRWFLNRNP